VNYNFLYDSNYINARNNGDYYHFGVVPVPLPTWNHVLDEFDREMKIQSETGDKEIVKHFSNYSIVIHQAAAIHPVVFDFLKLYCTWLYKFVCTFSYIWSTQRCNGCLVLEYSRWHSMEG
jgi:hypothetical protein